jgi:hypothetical protein
VKVGTTLGILMFSAAGAHASPTGAWHNDGVRSCMFDESVTTTKCAQYHQIVEHKVRDRESWREYRWMWKARNGLEVRYTSRTGIIGVSNFTIGELFDARSSLPNHVSSQAVSYSPSKEELVIGVPGEGYEFSVKGGGF